MSAYSSYRLASANGYTQSSKQRFEAYIRTPLILLILGIKIEKNELLGNPMNHRMCNPLCCYKNKREDCEHNLKDLRPPLFRSNSLESPLSSRPRSKRANAPDDIEVDQRTNRRDNHHRNANRVPVKTARRCVDPNRRFCKRAQTNRNTNAADRNHRRAGALQDNKNKARRADNPSRPACGVFRQHWF